MIERWIAQDIVYASLHSSRNAAIAETTSALSESNGGTDIYFYRLRGGVLYSSTHNIPVIESTTSQRDRDLIKQIESWANQNQEGLAVWVSPPQEVGEVSTKITLMRIISGNNYKMIENKSTLVDFKQEEINALIDYFLSCSATPQRYLSTDEARYSLIILAKKETEELTDQFFPDDWKEQKARIKMALEINQKIHQGEIISAGLELQGALGDYSLSCPTIRGGMTLVPKSIPLEAGARYLECTCPFCHHKVKAKIEGGRIQCPACGKSANYVC